MHKAKYYKKGDIVKVNGSVWLYEVLTSTKRPINFIDEITLRYINDNYTPLIYKTHCDELEYATEVEILLYV